MLRNLGLAGLVCVVVVAMTSSSEAGATGRSFKVNSSDGTAAGAAFGTTGNTIGPFVLPTVANKILVHTPDGDVNGAYTETQVVGGFVTTVAAGAFDNGYLGTFNALVIDLVIAPAQIVGVGVGTTGVYFFAGTAKN